jgi:hypothetical protein
MAGEGLAVGDFVGGEVGFGEEAAVGVDGVGELLGYLAVVEVVGLAARRSSVAARSGCLKVSPAA